MQKKRKIIEYLYPLMQEQGHPITYTVLSSYAPNYRTGDLKYTLTEHSLPRAITWSVVQAQKFEYDLAFVAANKNFTYGGFFTVGDRALILSDPPFTPSFRDFFVYNSKRYNVHKIQELDDAAGYILSARHTQAENRDGS